MQSLEINSITEKRDFWVPLNKWRDKIGVSSVTIWRWRKKNWLTAVNVGGKMFLRPEYLANFERRASAGEFASLRAPHCSVAPRPQDISVHN